MKIHGDGTWKYDFICSLCEACACAMYLQGTGLRTASGPFDWIAGMDFLSRAELIAAGFDGFLEKEDLVAQEWGVGNATDPNCDAFANKRNGLLFLHDFPRNVPLDDSFGNVREKYRRRIERFESRLRSGGRTLLVWVSRKSPMPEDVVLKGCDMITGLYGKGVDFLFVENDAGIPSRKSEECCLEGGRIRRIKLNMSGFHKIMGDVGYIASIFLQYGLTETGKRDSDRKLDRFALIRTAEAEERKMRKRKLRRKLRSAAGCIARLPHFLMARLRRRRYDNILMLGYNCELAFRAVCSWGGVDSGVFSWSSCRSLDDLISALGSFQEIGRHGWKDFKVETPLHVCTCSGLGFHGRAKTDVLAPNGKIDEEAIAADRRELESRLEYLKGKFLAKLRDDKPTLVMYKVWPKDCKKGIAEKLSALRSRLEMMGGRNFQLLAVCERSFVPAFAGKGSDLILRSVEKFNPNDDVTSRKLGDPMGWKILFTEFAPSGKFVSGEKKFKFEEEKP